MKSLGWAGILTIALLFCSRAWAEVAVSFPLEGHYRAGRYVPVRIVRTGQSGAVTISARGTVPTELPAGGEADVVVPWLVVSESAGDAGWQIAGGARQTISGNLAALNSNERLVGIAGGDIAFAKSLFPDQTIVPINLDLSRPLLDPQAAWESLDAVLLSPAAAGRIDSSHLESLLAGGTVIAVRGAEPPDKRWPWKRAGEYWVLSRTLPGPGGAVEPQAYVPTYGWERGWPINFRRAVVLGGVIFSILILAASLWRSRYAIAALVGLCVAGIVATAVWYSKQSPVLQLAMGVAVPQEGAAQYDLWSWLSSIRATDATFPFGGLTKPVLATHRQIEGEHLRLICDASGRPEQFAFHLEPNQSQAMLTRVVQLMHVHSLDQPLVPARGPFADLANELYARPGDRVLGEFTQAGAGAFPSMPIIVIQPAKQSSATRPLP